MFHYYGLHSYDQQTYAEGIWVKVTISRRKLHVFASLTLSMHSASMNHTIASSVLTLLYQCTQLA